MGHSLKFYIGQKLQKWVLYHAIHDPTNFWLSWDPTDSEDIRLLQKYVLLENNGSTAYLPSSTVKNLISLWNYMNLLIKQERPTEQKYNKLYYIMDEQWTKLTAHDMRTALVNENWKTRIHAQPLHLHLPCPISNPLHTMRSPIYMELASFKKGIKREASAYSILKNERYFEKFQRDLIITAKSHEVSEIVHPTFKPGSSHEEQELFDAKQTFMYKIFNENY